MSARFTPWKVTVIGLAALGVLSGCYVGGGGYDGYDGTVGVGYVGGYYAPGGYEYGGWDHGYRGVAPPRGGGGYGHGGDRGGDHGGGHGGGGGRSAPSIPSRGRGH